MENLFVFLATSLVLKVASPRFRRYLICPGCSALLNSGGKTLHVRYTKDGDKLFFNEYAVDGITYGMVCVQMKNVYTLKKSERILLQFIDRARKPLHIACYSSAEIERSQRFVTLTDYWQDKAGIDWKIKGYTNGKHLAFLYVKNITDTAVKNHDAYLNGFRFSALQ
jgi:hypothetical protein